MRLNDRLIRDTKKKDRARRSLDDAEEETMTYQERRTSVSLNTAGDVFDSRLDHGINSDKSIFDKTAIFQVKR